MASTTRRFEVRPAAARLSLTFAAALVAGGGCAHPPAPRFTHSAEFKAMAASVHGILQRDLDGDEREEVVVAARRDHGYTLRVLELRGDGGDARWTLRCASDLVVGEDIDAMRWLSFGDRPIVFILALTENPEEVRQAFALVDVGAGCATLFSDQVQVERPDPDRLLAPAGLWGGAGVSAGGERVRVLDEPQYLHLSGYGGEMRVLRAARLREIVAGAGGISVDETRPELLRTLSLRASREGSGPADELVDGRDETMIRAGAGETVGIALLAPRAIALLELHHGCGGDEPAPVLTLASGDGTPFTVGARPEIGSFVRGAGVARQDGGVRRALLALARPTATVTFAVGPPETDRCLREVKGYGFVLEAAPGAVDP